MALPGEKYLEARQGNTIFMSFHVGLRDQTVNTTVRAGNGRQKISETFPGNRLDAGITG